VATTTGKLPHLEGRCDLSSQPGLARRVPQRSGSIPLTSAIDLEPIEAPTEEAIARSLGAPARETLLVLAQDASLIATVRAVAPSERELLFVGAETDLATQLITSGAGVAVIDSAATLSSITQLVRGLKRQFPDLVLIVAGGAAEQSALTAQVSSGEVYRFLHKPASEQRVRLFVDAAWRRREKGDAGGATMTVAQLPQLSERRLPIGLIVAAAFGVAALAGLLGWLMGQHGTQKVLAPPIAIAPSPHRAPLPATPPTDTALKELLERAGAALERGDWVMPAGSSAADLYRQALEHHAGDAQALVGIDKVIDQVLSAAEQDLLAQHLDEAEHMTDAARALAPNSPRVAFLSTQISRERERLTRAQARQQAQQQQVDALAHQQELLASARTALTAGKLDDAARAIDTASEGGASAEAIDVLRRDLQAARIAAHLAENVAKPASPPASIAEAAPSPAQALTPAAPPTAQASASLVPAPSVTQDESSGSADAILSAGALERLQYVAPEYPKSAREKGTSGWVQLAFNVESDGSVANIAVLASDPKNVFDEAAIAALRRWRYRPVEQNGKPIEQRVQLRIRFTLH
jgi:protein TonB